MKSLPCLSVYAYTFMLLGSTACAISFLAPFWLVCDDGCNQNVMNALVRNPQPVIFKGALKSIGLLGFRDSSQSCTWIWNDNFALEKNLRDVVKVVQGLNAMGMSILVVCIFLSTTQTCCCGYRGYHRLRYVIGSLCLCSVVCIGSSLATFCVYIRDNLDTFTTLHWALYLGLAGITSCLISSILYFLKGCREDC